MSSSLHARRPPKLEQGDLRRKRVAAGHHITAKGGGGGSLRRPPTAPGMEVSMGGGNGGSSGGGGGGSNKRFCSPWRIMKSILAIVLLAFLFVQVRDTLFGKSNAKNNGSGLRARQIIGSIEENSAAKPG